MHVGAPAATAIEPEWYDRADVHVEEIFHSLRRSVRRMRPSGRPPGSLADFKLQEKDADFGELIELPSDTYGMHRCLRSDHLPPFLIATPGAQHIGQNGDNTGSS